MGQFHGELKSILTKLHQRGDFELSCGGHSGDYFDLAPLFLNPDNLRVVSYEVVSTLSNLEFDALGCLELCPVPLIGAVLISAFTDKRGFVVRKKRKGHGTNKLIEGDLRLYDKVVVLEDVTSTGRSVMKVIRTAEEFGCVVVCVLTVINRREGCDELLGNYDFRYLFTKEEL